MKTTVELPDALIREAEARGVLAGKDLKDMLAEGLRLLLARTAPAPKSDSSAEVQAPKFVSPALDYDEDDLVDWDVDFTPPPSPTRMINLRMEHVGPAPIPDLSEGES